MASHSVGTHGGWRSATNSRGGSHQARDVTLAATPESGGLGVGCEGTLLLGSARAGGRMKRPKGGPGARFRRRLLDALDDVKSVGAQLGIVGRHRDVADLE